MGDWGEDNAQAPRSPGSRHWQSRPPVTSPGHRPPYPQLRAPQSQSSRVCGPERAHPGSGSLARSCSLRDRRVREAGAADVGRCQTPPAGALTRRNVALSSVPYRGRRPGESKREDPHRGRAPPEAGRGRARAPARSGCWPSAARQLGARGSQWEVTWRWAPSPPTRCAPSTASPSPSLRR